LEGAKDLPCPKQLLWLRFTTHRATIKLTFRKKAKSGGAGAYLIKIILSYLLSPTSRNGDPEHPGTIQRSAFDGIGSDNGSPYSGQNLKIPSNIYRERNFRSLHRGKSPFSSLSILVGLELLKVEETGSYEDIHRGKAQNTKVYRDLLKVHLQC
jgi:hypothetical protein